MSTPTPTPSVTLPEIVETKHYLDGRAKEFRCRLIEQTPDSAVLLYISPGGIDLFGLTLPPGTVTFGYYWTDRDYNIYHWQHPHGGTIAVYFNLVDGTRITPDGLAWRDLAVDILATPGGRVDVLDEDELPADADPAVHATVERAKATILGDHDAIVAEVERRSRALWPQVFGEAE